MTIKLHCDDESGRALKINIAPCLCKPYTQASEIGWGGVPWGRYVGRRSCALNIFNHNRRSDFPRAASPQPGKNTFPMRGPDDAHSTLDIFFFALQIFYPCILRFPPTRPVPAAMTDVSGFAGASPTQVSHRKAHGFVSRWRVGLSLLWPPEDHIG